MKNSKPLPEVARLGSRGSDLALWQTNHVAQLLKKAYPSLQTEIKLISTKGDKVLDTPLPLIGGKGLFTAELESALRKGEIDFAVHSLKDLPTENPEGLIIGAILERANPVDVLVSREHYTLDTLPQNAVVGTSSNRRAAQLTYQRPDLRIENIRGNIGTRIDKALASDSKYDAIVLAYAGISRLDMHAVVSDVLSFEQMLPAPGQGALGIQCRDETTSLNLLKAIRHFITTITVTAERSFLEGLGGGCSVPVAAYAYQDVGNTFVLKGRVGSIDGSEQIEVEIRFEAENEQEATQAGHELSRTAIKNGADRLLRAQA